MSAWCFTAGARYFGGCIDKVHTREADQDVDQSTHSGECAKDSGHQIESEQAEETPVYSADDDQYQGNPSES